MLCSQNKKKQDSSGRIHKNMDAEKLFIELLESLLVLKTDLFTMHYSEGKLYEVVSVLYDFDVNVFSKSFQQLEIHVLKFTC